MVFQFNSVCCNKKHCPRQCNKQDVVFGGLNGPGEKKIVFPSNVGKSLWRSNEKRAILRNSPITFVSKTQFGFTIY